MRVSRPLLSLRLALLISLVVLNLLPPISRATASSSSAVLTIGVLALPHTLNPLLNPLLPAADISEGVFDSLLSADTHDTLQPDLASGYSVSSDGRRIQFQLDPRAHWQDGVPVTADDVLFTARLMRDRRFPALNRFGFGQIDTLSSDGPLTVTVTLRAPYAPFVRAFATTPLLPAHVLSPIPIEQIAHYDAFNRRPLGSGPYAVTEFQDGDHVTLTANSAYFRGAPHIQQIVFHVEPSETAALAALRAGVVQMLGPSVGITPADLLATLAGGRFSAYASPGFGWTHIDLIESGFLRDHLVRQALAYATPRQRIVATLFKGLVTPADADQPPTSQYYEPAVAGSYPYDPAKVASLLIGQQFKRKHGVYVKYGRELRITLWLDNGCATCLETARVAAASWTAAGIPTTVRPVPTLVLFGTHGPLYGPDRLYNPELNAVLYTWATSAEPDDAYYWATSMIVRPGHLAGGNFDGYSDARVDTLTSQALTTTDERKRIAIYQQIQRLLVTDQPDIFLFWTSHLSLAVSSLHGYEANPFRPGVTWNANQWTLQ